MIKPRHNLALKPLTTFGVVGTAATAWRLDDVGLVDALLEALASSRTQGAAPSPRPFILGGGSNILFARDLPEPLILVRLRGRRRIDDDGENVLLEVAAGENWDETVRFSLSQGWYGLENLSLIPGLMGGAPWQNIGAYGVEVSRFIDSVDAIHLGNGERRTFAAVDCAFGYRSSFFKTTAGRDWLITAVRLRLSRRAQPSMGYPEVEQEVAALSSSVGASAPEAAPGDRFDGPSPEQVAAAVCSLRRRKLPDPVEIGNAGSFFKNPIVSRDRLEALRTTHPKMPSYPVADDPSAVKLSAGWLIEAAGWKGFREGDAGVSSRHALVLVNHGAATGVQILALARRIERSVFEGFGVTLEAEPVIVS
jgi:UDP-N-acetylmuramate dehydrogenase